MELALIKADLDDAEFRDFSITETVKQISSIFKNLSSSEYITLQDIVLKTQAPEFVVRASLQFLVDFGRIEYVPDRVLGGTEEYRVVLRNTSISGKKQPYARPAYRKRILQFLNNAPAEKDFTCVEILEALGFSNTCRNAKSISAVLSLLHKSGRITAIKQNSRLHFHRNRPNHKESKCSTNSKLPRTPEVLLDSSSSKVYLAPFQKDKIVYGKLQGDQVQYEGMMSRTSATELLDFLNYIAVDDLASLIEQLKRI